MVAVDEIGQYAFAHPWSDDTGDRPKVVGESDERQDVWMVKSPPYFRLPLEHLLDHTSMSAQEVCY